MTQKTIGIGLIGAGLIGAIHSHSLRQIAERLHLPIRLAGVADLEPAKVQAFKANFGFEKTFLDPLELIRDPSVDAVYICTWTAAHPGLVVAAAAEGKHVFCEKPLAFDAPGAREMLAAVKAAGVIHQVGLVLRQGPVWNVLREEIASRAAGFPIALVFRDDQCFPVKGAHPSAWRRDATRAGHGTILEHSIHDLDLLEWIFGPIESLRAEIAFRFGCAGIEDLARVDLAFGSGMTGALVSVWHDVLNRHSDRRLEVFHERLFTAVESEFTGPIQVMEGESPLITISEPEVNRRFWSLRGIEDPGERELSLRFGAWEDYLFCRAVLEGRPAEPDFGVAVRAHELVDACYESARLGQRINVNRARKE